MNVPKQLINLLGIVVVIGVVVAGVALIALPLYGGSQTTDAQARTVAQTNDVYDIQVQQLSAEKKRMTEITTSLDDLRREIAAIPQLDDAYEIVIAAAAETGATITTVAAGEPEPWVAFGSDVEDPSAAAPAPTEPTTTDGGVGSTDAGTTPSADGSAAAPADRAGETSPQQQIPLTITVEIPDATQAAAFMDALGRGPRLLSPTNGTLTDGTLTVSALAFIRTGD